MTRFASVRDAKEFLVGQIIEEARVEGVKLSELERRMLYFSEADQNSSDLAELSDAFNREHNDQEYEEKIRRLIRNARKRARAASASTAKAWRDAIATLRTGDHYLLVMIDQQESATAIPVTWRAIALVASLGIVFSVLAAVASRYVGHDIDHDPNVVFFLWAVPASLTAIYLVLRVVLGAPTADKLLDKLLGPITRAVERFVRR
jgi:hypothetical protein